MGYSYLDAAEKQGQQALEATLTDLSRRIGSATESHGPMAVTVLNPHSWPRTDVVATGRMYPLPAGTKDIVVKDRTGKAVPSQIVRSSKDLKNGDLIVAEVAFQAQQVPSAGYDTNPNLKRRDRRIANSRSGNTLRMLARALFHVGMRIIRIPS